MGKGLFDKASIYREEFLARQNDGLLAQALDYLNSKDNADTAAEIKSNGEPVLPSLPNASEFHPVDDPTCADTMPDEEIVRQRMAEIEEQVSAAESETSPIDSTNTTEQADAKSEETFFLEGNAVQEQQPDYEEEVLIIDLPKDDDPFAALLAQMGGDSGQTTSETEATVSSAEPVEEQDVINNAESIIQNEETESDNSAADENTDTSTEESPAENNEESLAEIEEEPSTEEVTQGTSFVGNNIVYDANAVTEKTFTSNNVSFTTLPPLDAVPPKYEEPLPPGIQISQKAEDDEINVPDEDNDEELPSAEDLPTAAEKIDEAAAMEEEHDFSESKTECLYPDDSIDENEQEAVLSDDEQSEIVTSTEDVENEQETIDNSECIMHNEEDELESLGEPCRTDESNQEETSIADEKSAEIQSPDEITPKQYDDYLAVLDDISAQTAAIAIDENMFDNFLACIADRFEIDQCGLLLFDPDDGQFKCLSRIGYDEETEDKLVFDLNYNDIYANLANKKSYIVHRDEPQFGGLADIMSEKDYAEAEFQLWLPFVFSSRIIGIMLVTHSMSAVTDDYIRALEVAGRLNGATLYNLYQQYTVLCEEYEDEDENLDAEQLAEENEQLETDISTPFNDHASEEDSSFTESVEVNENEEKSDEVPADTEEIIEDDDAEFSEEEFAAELMSEWDNAGENEESSEESSIDNSECIMHNDEDNNEADTSENEADTSDEEITPSTEPVEVAEDDSIIIEETPIEEEIIEESESTMDQAPLTEENEDETPIEDTDSFDEQGRTDESIDNSSPDELAEAELAIEAAITDDVIEAEYTIPSDNEMASEIDSIIIDESSFGEENETEQSAECEVQDDDSSNVIPTEANEVSEAEKSDEVNDDENSIIIEETSSEDNDVTENAINETMLEDMGLALPDDEPIEVLPIPDDLDAKYRGIATFMHDLRETGAALSLCRVILTSFADVTAAVGEFSLIQFAEDIKGTTQSIIGGDSFVEVTDSDKFYIVLPNAEKEEAQAATEMIIEQIVGLFSEAFGDTAEFRFECTANDTFTQSDYLSLLNELP